MTTLSVASLNAAAHGTPLTTALAAGQWQWTRLVEGMEEPAATTPDVMYYNNTT